MQAGGELARFPGCTGDQLDEWLPFDFIGRKPQGKGETRAGGTDTARRVNLPQPVRLALLELAQQHRDDFALLCHRRFGNACRQEETGILDRAQPDDNQEGQRKQRHFHAGRKQEADDRGSANDTGKQQVAQRNGGQQDCGCRHQHGADGPQLQVVGRRTIRRECGQRQGPGHGIGRCAERLALDLVARDAAAVGIAERLVDPCAIEQTGGQHDRPANQCGRMDALVIKLQHRQGGDPVGQPTGDGYPGKAGILQPAHAGPVPFSGFFQSQYCHDRQALGQGGRSGFCFGHGRSIGRQ